jgi:hypothetical protein
MTLKQTALVQTAGICATMLALSLGVNLLFTVLTAQDLATLLVVVSITFLVYSVYQVVLSRLEYSQKLDEITKK